MNRIALRELLQHDAPAVSIYLPTERAGPQTQQNRIRWRQAIRTAQATLEERGDADGGLLAPLEAMSDDRELWQHPKSGLAVLRTRHALVRERLSYRVPERCVVGDHVHVAPLAPSFEVDGRFYLLGLDENRARLWAGDAEGLEPRTVEGLPDGLTSVVGRDVEPDSLQVYTVSSGAARHRPRAQFHGHGYGHDDRDPERLAYARSVDRALLAHADLDRPLLLAAAQPLAGIFLRVSRIPSLLPALVHGSPESLGDADLHRRAWQVAEPHLYRERDVAIEAFRERRGSGSVADLLPHVLSAMCDGRVECLLVARDARVFGVPGPHGRWVETHEPPREEDRDLVDWSIAQALRTRARIFTLPPGEFQRRVTDESPLAALLRF